MGKYPFLLEKILLRANVPHPYYTLSIIYGIILISIGSICLGYIARPFQFNSELVLWVLPGPIVIIFQIIGIKYLRDSSIQVFDKSRNIISKNRDSITIEQLLKCIYEKNYNFIFACIISGVACIVQYYLLFLSPETAWHNYLAKNFLVTSILSIVSILAVGTFFFVSTHLIFFIGGSVYILFQISKKIDHKKTDLFSPDNMCGLSILTSYTKIIIVCWLLGTIPILNTLAFSNIVFLTHPVLTVFSLTTIALFSFLIYLNYDTLKISKELALNRALNQLKMRKTLGDKIKKESSEIIRTPIGDTVRDWNIQQLMAGYILLNALTNDLIQISKLKTFPIESGILISIILTFISPIFTLLINTYL